MEANDILGRPNTRTLKLAPFALFIIYFGAVKKLEFLKEETKLYILITMVLISFVVVIMLILRGQLKRLQIVCLSLALLGSFIIFLLNF